MVQQQELIIRLLTYHHIQPIVKVKLTNVYEGVKQKETTFEYGDEARILKELIS